MDPQFKDIIEDITEWISTGAYKDALNISYDKELNLTVADYITLYCTDKMDSDEDFINLEIPLTVYIKKDMSFQIEFDLGMFNTLYGGYESPEDIEICNDFMKYAKKNGYLYGKLILIK